MKGLRKYLSPFTPDQSGAVSVLFDFGGMLVIMDAGGCVGNICGYDEPRWTTQKSAIFSSCLRDMDAILGRDDLLVSKIGDALKMVDVEFIGLIGTPVPAVIATDFRALKRMIEKRYNKPVLPIETNGILLYDVGEEMAYNYLLREFVENRESSNKAFKAHDIGVWGATPLDTLTISSPEQLRATFGEDVICYGAGATIEDVAHAGEVKKNIVVSPAGLSPARWLQEEFGTPYEVRYPLDPIIAQTVEETRGKRVLILHQQVIASELRKMLRDEGEYDRIDIGNWFKQDDQLREEGDRVFVEEEDLMKREEQIGYDVIIGDPLYRRALPNFTGRYLDLPHFAVSGALHQFDTDQAYYRGLQDRWNKR